jgi:hypothetical protein
MRNGVLGRCKHVTQGMPIHAAILVGCAIAQSGQARIAIIDTQPCDNHTIPDP